MHLLVNNAHRLDSPKLVRDMIFKGADRKIKNNAGLTPLDSLNKDCEDNLQNGDGLMNVQLKNEL